MSGFWLLISVSNGIFWGVLGLFFDGVLAGLLLFLFGFFAMLLVGGMLTSGGDKKEDE